MFGKKKTDTLIENIDSYFDSIDRSLLVYKEGVRNYLYASDRKDFDANLKSLSELESRASELRRKIENALYTQTALIRSRGDIMRLLEKTRNIMDMLGDSLQQFEIETPFIPQELCADFIRLTEFSTLALETTVPAAKAYFRDPKSIPDRISRAYYYEKEATRCAQEIKRTVFHKMDKLKLSEKFHLRYFALHIENLSKAADGLADQLAVMSIRRTM